MKTKLRGLVGGVALLLVLAACYPGASSQEMLSYDLQVTVTKGKVNLNDGLWNSGPETQGFINPHGLQGPYYYPRSHLTSRADFDLTFTQTQGNWNVKGKWVDGFVKMEFAGKSEYLTALLNHCMSNVGWTYQEQLWYWEIQEDAYGYDFNAKDCDEFYFIDDWIGGINSPANPKMTYGKFIRGGCVYIPTLYRSLNPDYVGTGHALLFVCQNGEGTYPLTPSWSNPSYVEVWIPDTTDISSDAIGDIDLYLDGDEDDGVGDDGGEDEYYFAINFEDNVYYSTGYFSNDNSPFRNYYAGGTNTNRSGKWVVQVRFNELDASPFPTQSPLFSTEWYGIP